MNKFYSEGNYSQRVELEGNKVVNIYCTCMFDTIESSRVESWKDKKLCRHIKELLKKLNANGEIPKDK